MYTINAACYCNDKPLTATVVSLAWLADATAMALCILDAQYAVWNGNRIFSNLMRTLAINMWFPIEDKLMESCVS